MSRSASFAISGTNWIAEAPVPITATLRPARSWEWSHSAEWKTAALEVLDALDPRHLRDG